ncbi:MAG: GTPase Era [Deltaproteobacteria bacterium]|nr:GTPase Era [Deltaproteobacteria bacterium]
MITHGCSPGEQDHRSGFVALVGPPNAGKSTLMNRILGRKVAIVSPKPQTTRNRILGIYHEEGLEIAFVDTPGIHRTRTALHQSMVSSAKETFQEVDLVAVMIDRARPEDRDVSLILSQLQETRKPALLVINKIDTGPRETLLPIMDRYGKRYPFEAIVPLSALSGDGVDLFLEEIKVRLKPGPAFFPPDMDTDQTEAFMVAEIIREKVYLKTGHELPYAAAVTVEAMEERTEKGIWYIAARIHVETPSQKKILIGRGGSMIKRIGEEARREVESRFSARVYLDLTVRVEKNWTRDTRALRRLGY